MMTRAFSRVWHMRSYLRLRSFDISTEAGRSNERQRRLALTALASALARATSIATSLISVPLTLHYLGTERYGMWMTMSAFTAMLSFADLGIGNGVLTAVARANGRNELHTVRPYVSSAFILLSTISMLILLGMVATYSKVEWSRLFNVSSTLARAEAGPAVFVFICCFAFMLPLSIVQRVQLGLQMGFMSALWQCAGSLLGLAGVLTATLVHAGLPWLVLAFSGAPLITAATNSILFFIRLRPQFSPRLSATSYRHGYELARLGTLFFVLQVVVAVAYTSDNLLIAQKLGASAVAQYAVPDRLFAMASMVVGLATAPLWPAFGEAVARGDHLWARRALIRSTVVAGSIAAAICVCFVLIGPTLLKVWVGPSIAPPLLLLIGFALWRTIEATAGASSMFLNGIQAIRFQITTAIITGLFAIITKLQLLQVFGIVAVPWITSIVYILATGIPIMLFLRRHDPHARSRHS